MFGFGAGELIVVGVILFLLFGAKRLPEIGKGLGGAIREFKKVKKDLSLKGEGDDLIRPRFQAGKSRYPGDNGRERADSWEEHMIGLSWSNKEGENAKEKILSLLCSHASLAERYSALPPLPRSRRTRVWRGSRPFTSGSSSRAIPT